jgi:hypothetical protein
MFFLISFGLLGLFLIFFYYGTIHNIPALTWAAFVSGVMALLIVVSMMLFYNLRKNEIGVSFEMMVKKELDDYFSDLNKKFIHKGLWWRVVPGHYWVELRID